MHGDDVPLPYAANLEKLALPQPEDIVEARPRSDANSPLTRGKTMPIKILMPALSPTMTEGKLAKWHDKEGDEVKSGDVIAEIETDKATMEVEAVDEGKLGKILVPEGAQGVKVNAVIALLLEEGETPAARGRRSAAAPAARRRTARAKPAAARPAAAAPAPAAPKPAPAARPRRRSRPQPRAARASLRRRSPSASPRPGAT